MTYDRTHTAIIFGDAKTAAIYFDRVLPIEFRTLIRGDQSGMFSEIPEPIETRILTKLIYGNDTPWNEIGTYLGTHWSNLIKQVSPGIMTPIGSNSQEGYSELRAHYLANSSSPETGSIRDAFREFAKKLGIESYSVLLSESHAETSYSEAYTCLAASNLSLVDTSHASWEQIIELREDANSKRHLRRLRLFFLENYTGKPTSYIEDDLMYRIDCYEDACKKHGFETILSSINVLLEANSLQAVAVAGITSALFGGPIAGISAGTAVEVGKVLIHLAKKRAEIRNLSAGHELGYVIQANRKL